MYNAFRLCYDFFSLPVHYACNNEHLYRLIPGIIMYCVFYADITDIKTIILHYEYKLNKK